MEAHAVVAVGDAEVVHVAGKDPKVYEEEHQGSCSEHHALWEEEHSQPVPPPHCGGRTDSSPTVEAEQASTVQEKQLTPPVVRSGIAVGC